jgi:hypothetical protein
MMEALIIWEINQYINPDKHGIGKIKDDRRGGAYRLFTSFTSTLT